MAHHAHTATNPGLRAASRTMIPWSVCMPGIAIAELGMIVLLSVAAGWAYHQVVYEVAVDMTAYALFGLFVALAFVLVSSAQGQYRFSTVLANNIVDRTLFCWTAVYLLAIAFVFLLKAGAEISRMATLIFYIAGLTAIVCFRHGVRHAALAGVASGWLASRRVMVVGARKDISTFLDSLRPHRHGLAVVGRAVTDGSGGEMEDIVGVVEQARRLRPDGIVLLLPWSKPDDILRWLDALMAVPTTIHLAPPPAMLRLRRLPSGWDAVLSDLILMRAPMSRGERIAKRIFDAAIAAAGLVLLSPLLLLIAGLVKLDSPGPALYRQQRYGFNQDPFWIYKFRTMSSAEGSQPFRQAVRNDPRVTRIGRVLRQWSLDELPQLLNVLRGDMSLVGPRPHVEALHEGFTARIAQYARRHSMKPGITGWAQIHGLRGETDSDDKMRERVEHDLYYIDNWSLWFDLKILVRTFLSPRTFQNAY